MPKDEWGVKRLCPHCASRFYDLQRDPMTCPECGHTFSLESLTSTGRNRTLVSEKSAAKPVEADVDDLAAEDDLDDDSGDDLDDDLLDDGDDDDDVSLDDIADVASDDDD